MHFVKVIKEIFTSKRSDEENHASVICTEHKACQSLLEDALKDAETIVLADFCAGDCCDPIESLQRLALYALETLGVPTMAQSPNVVHKTMIFALQCFSFSRYFPYSVREITCALIAKEMPLKDNQR